MGIQGQYDYREAKESQLLYLFGYRMFFSTFQNNSKTLDPSYKAHLNFADC